MKPVGFLIDGIHVEASQDEDIRSACERAEVEISSSCGGFGTCGACRVFVESGGEALAAPNEIETEMIRDREFHSNERLSCQTHPVNGLVLRRPPPKP